MSASKPPPACHVVWAKLDAPLGPATFSCDTLAPDELDQIAVAAAAWRDTSYAVARIEQVRAHHGLAPIVVIQTLPQWRSSELTWTPAASPFEPARLVESDPGVAALADGQTVDAAIRRRRGSALSRAATRLGVPLALYIVLPLNAVVNILATRSWTTVGIWIGVMAACVLGAIVVGLLSVPWYLVPGGVVIRRVAPWRLNERIELCTARDATLMLRPGPSGWLAEVWRMRSGNPAVRVDARSLTERETSSLLAAWCSPVPPPPPERLAELGTLRPAQV